jgi:hypothetical protein
MSRPGATSRFLGQGVAFQPQLPHRGQLAAVPDLVEPGRLAPGVHSGCCEPGGQDRGEFLLGVFEFSVGFEQFDELLAQFRQNFDVERCVPEPGFRQGTGGPVGCRVLLGEPKTKQLLDHGREADAGKACQTGCQFSVEKFVRPHTQLRQAGQVLAGGVQDPFDAPQGIVDDPQVPERLGVDQPGSRTLPTDLDEERALPVAEARGALCVNAGRARAGGDRGSATFQPGLGFDDQRHAVAGRIEIDDNGDLAVKAFHRYVGCVVSSRSAGCGVIRILRGHDDPSLPAAGARAVPGQAGTPAPPSETTAARCSCRCACQKGLVLRRTPLRRRGLPR